MERIRKEMSYWRIWAKSLGDKSGTTDRESDLIALVRTVIILTYIITNCFIVAGVIRHW
jgi:hypothetical protein